MLTQHVDIFKTINYYFNYNLLNFDITAPAYNSQILRFPMGPLYQGSTVYAPLCQSVGWLVGLLLGCTMVQNILKMGH